MELSVERREDARMSIVRLEGEIDIATVPEIRTAVETEVRAGAVNIVLGLSRVTYADSSALGMIVWIDRLLDPRGGKLVLAGATRDVSRVLELSGLIGLAPTLSASDSVADAVGAFDITADAQEPLWVETIYLPADVAALADARARVCDLIAPLTLAEAALFDVRVAVGEALANAVRHGSETGADEAVSVRVTAYDDRVAITVTDTGTGFDGMTGAQDDLYAASGRGVMFMRALMDRVEFVRSDDGGTQVTLTKHLEEPR